MCCTEICLCYEQWRWQEQQNPTLTPRIQMCQSECFLWCNLLILLPESSEWFMWAASGVQWQAYYPNMVDRFIWTHWRGRNLPAEAVTESSVWALFTLMALSDFNKTGWLSLMNRAAHPSNFPFLFPHTQTCYVLFLMKCLTKHSWQHTLRSVKWFLDDLQFVDLCQVIFVKWRVEQNKGVMLTDTMKQYS